MVRPLPPKNEFQTTLPGFSNPTTNQDEKTPASSGPRPRPGAKTGRRTVHLPRVGPVLLERSHRARRLILSVRSDRVRVAVPRHTSFQRAEEFARANTPWILDQLARVREAESRDHHLRAGLDPIDRKTARTHLVARLEELSAYHGFAYNQVSIRDQRTRWGSCSSANNLSLNMKLLWLPSELQDYVLLHELAHTRIPDHSRRFWDLLERVCPGARRLRRELKDYRHCLSAGEPDDG